MNRLAFSEFHQKHFGPEQTAYWSAMIQQQQQQQQQPQYEEYYSFENDYSQHANESHYAHDDYEHEEEQDEYHELSEEAIEIFRFSEAYRKEKELARLKAEQEETEGMQDWQYDESNVHCSGGQEAPVTSLVLTSTVRPVKQSKNRIQEELLNSAYLSSCRHDGSPIVLWPVIPFRI
jgi:hypothetical protein